MLTTVKVAVLGTLRSDLASAFCFVSFFLNVWAHLEWNAQKPFSVALFPQLSGTQLGIRHFGTSYQNSSARTAYLWSSGNPIILKHSLTW